MWNNSTTGKRRIGMLAILVAAVCLRVVAAIAVHQHVESEGRQFLVEGDADGYWSLAKSVSFGRDYSIHTPPRRVLRTPGFPLLLSLSICTFGSSILAARIVLAIVGAGCCWLTYLLGRRLFNRPTGFLAAAFVCLHPMHIGNSVLILSETWFAFLMLLSLLLLERTLRQLSEVAVRWRRIAVSAGLAGLVIGAAVLIRPGFLLWIVAAAAMAIAVKSPAWNRITAVGSIALGMLIVMLPWALRNQQVSGHLVFTSLWSGPSLYDGLNPDADGGSNMDFFDRENVMATMSEFEMNEHYKAKAVSYAKDHPSRAALLALAKAGRYLSPLPNNLKERHWIIDLGCYSLFFLLYAGVALGIWKARATAQVLLLTLGPFLMFLAVHMVFVGSVRYRLPVEFGVAVLGAHGWLSLWRQSD